MQKRPDQKPVRKRKFVSEGSYVTEQECPSKSSKETYVENLRARVLVERQRAKTVKSRAKRDGKSPRGKPKMDFAQLDQRGTPAVSFDPDSPLRLPMVELFDKSKRDPERIAIMAKIGTEFGRIYTRYRRNAERSLGQRPSLLAYEIPKREKEYAADAGMYCIIKGITPRELLQYWHKNIRTFADRRMKLPPLALLKSPGIVDSAACASLQDDPAEKPNKGKEDGDLVPSQRNSFSDETLLDRRLRRGLERAGHDTQDFNDRFMLTIQKIAISVARGQKIFVPMRLKPMASWAAENLYANAV